MARLIAATPGGQMDGLARLRDEADLVVCPHPLEEIAVVGQAYDIFDPLDEWYGRRATGRRRRRRSRVASALEKDGQGGREPVQKALAPT